MSSKHLTYFKVENFKRFDSLEVKDIGQFNLIVGDNNVGKTSLLEALLFDDENYNQFLKNIANALIYNRRITIPEDVINYLDFYLKNKKQSINLRYEYADKQCQFIVSKAVLSDLSDEEMHSAGGRWAAKSNNTRHLIKFDLDGNIEFRFASIQFLIKEEEWDNSSMRFYPFIGFNSNSGDDIFNFSKISISTSQLESLQTELKYFIPNLVSVEINNAVVPNTSIIAIRETNADLQPLSYYGDGAIKLFRYLLELELCEDKRLMIDEIDAGIHYSRMKGFLMKMIQSAKDKNVQIFATTHSKECIKYYTEALEELNMQDCGRIIKLANTKIGIRAYSMGFEEFENAMIADSEIR